MNSGLIIKINELCWSLYLPSLILIGTYVNLFVFKSRNKHPRVVCDALTFKTIRSSLSISLASKVGTGAIIGVLAAMWQNSNQGASSGLGLIFWILLSMLILVPITYSEVFLTQSCKLTPRNFIDKYLNKRLGTIYGLSLITLYCFGFVGFQLTGIQTVVRFVSKEYLNYQFTTPTALMAIIIPILLLTALIVALRRHDFFINILSSVIFFVIVFYIIFFIFFLLLTSQFIPIYLVKIMDSVLDIQSASTGILLGLIIASQRIIQISETSLGTSALSSSDSQNTPQQESFIQTMATLLSIGIAVVITSYIYSYGLESFDEVILANNTFDRLIGFLLTIYKVTGYLGLVVIVLFFILSGFTTILGSFHFLNSTLKIKERHRIYTYLILIFTSGILSVFHFDVVFEITNLLMFIVGSINIISLASFIFNKQNGPTI